MVSTPAKQQKKRPKAPGARVRLSVADRRRQLLDLGLRAFADRSYDAVSIDEIAEQAGISRSLLFHYFASKHDYYAAVLGRAAEALLEQTVTPGDGPPAERLAAGLHAYFRFVDQHAPTYATLLRGGVGFDPVVQELVETTRRRFVDTIREHIEPLIGGGDPARLRAALRGWIGLVEALALDWIEHRDLPVDEIVAMAIRGIAVTVPGAEEILGNR